jgi:hypothetical protein
MTAMGQRTLLLWSNGLRPTHAPHRRPFAAPGLALPQACPGALCHTRRSVTGAGVPRMEQLEKIVALQQFAMH